ncbi:hypothetical protein [Algoriphagus antarcticus]|uniref:hypothetical protein n=1 Tax=Algoriphagus antarcticus TaxID=238540 RepID=UPI0011C02BB6|nr:hypothetical protein [Algoriphagus antarcticus]
MRFHTFEMCRSYGSKVLLLCCGGWTEVHPYTIDRADGSVYSSGGTANFETTDFSPFTYFGNVPILRI